MPIVERIETWHGQDVLDGAGEKLGRLDEVYYDPSTHEPVLISVKHGMLGRQVSLVPVADAVVSHDYLQVPYSAEQLERAQSSQLAEELSAEQVAAVSALFSLTPASNGPLYSASLIERRRAEADAANEHAHELQRAAQERAQELEQARARAGAAAEEAQAAEREREKARAAALEASRQPPPPE